MTPTMPLKSTQCHICLSDTEDVDVIQWLSTIKKGYRNSLIKNITRSYLSRPITDNYFETNKTSENINEISNQNILESIMAYDLPNASSLDMDSEIFKKIINI